MLETRGRPTIPTEEKILPNGLVTRQWNRLKAMARKRGVSAAFLLRQIVDWYFESIDNKEK